MTEGDQPCMKRKREFLINSPLLHGGGQLRGGETLGPEPSLGLFCHNTFSAEGSAVRKKSALIGAGRAPLPHTGTTLLPAWELSTLSPPQLKQLLAPHRAAGVPGTEGLPFLTTSNVHLHTTPQMQLLRESLGSRGLQDEGPLTKPWVLEPPVHPCSKHFLRTCEMPAALLGPGLQM